MNSNASRPTVTGLFVILLGCSLGANLGCASSGGGTGRGQTGGATTGGTSGGGTGGSGSGGRVGSGGTGTGGIVSSTGGSSGTSTGGSGGSDSGGRGGAVATGGSSSGGAVATGGAPSGGGGGSAGGRSGTGGHGGTAGVGGSGRGGAASGGAGGTVAYQACPTDGTACKIMPFGDSITDGYNPDTPGGYRIELFRRAHAGGKNITFVGSQSNGPDMVDGVPFPHNHEGHSGWTIAPAGSRSGISTLVATVMPQYKPNIILLMIGTNDAIDNYDMANAPTRLGALIDSIYAQLPNVLIIVAQPIPSRGDASKGDDTALSARIKTYDDAIPAVVKARADAGRHITTVDLYTPFNPNKTSLLEDQWHPNLQGYVLLGTQWYTVLQPSL